MLESIIHETSVMGDQTTSLLSGGQFERVAATITEWTAVLFSAEVTVTDTRGIVVSSSA